jgi:prepilin-type N-terminal cleavage/methylation domain-containing protein
MTIRKNHGFSLLELMIVIAIGLTMASISFMALQPLLKQSHVDNAYDITLGTLRTYRNRAITEGKRYIITFAAPGTITVQYWGVAVPVSPAPVTVATVTLPSDIQFAVQGGFPSTPATVPDGFGAGTTAIGFNNCVVVVQSCLIFYPDGSAQDDKGNPNSGVLYLTRPTDLYSSRAITVFGYTGRVRGWRLYNQAGTNKWVQQ